MFLIGHVALHNTMFIVVLYMFCCVLFTADQIVVFLHQGIIYFLKQKGRKTRNVLTKSVPFGRIQVST